MLALALVALFSPLTWADAPEAVLGKIDALVGNPSFEESFVSGDASTVAFIENLRGMESKSTSIVTITRTGNRVDVIGRRTDGTAGSEEELNQALWTRWKGNYLRSLTEFFEGYGYKLDLTLGGEEFFTVIVNGVSTSVKGVRVNVAGAHPMGSKMTASFVVTGTLPGAAQILYRDESVTGIVRKWTLHEFKRP